MTQKLEHYCNQLTHASDPDYVTQVCNESFYLFSYFDVVCLYVYYLLHISVACKF